jgi:hypothetical protein
MQTAHATLMTTHISLLRRLIKCVTALAMAQVHDHSLMATLHSEAEGLGAQLDESRDAMRLSADASDHYEPSYGVLLQGRRLPPETTALLQALQRELEAAQAWLLTSVSDRTANLLRFAMEQRKQAKLDALPTAAAILTKSETPSQRPDSKSGLTSDSVKSTEIAEPSQNTAKPTTIRLIVSPPSTAPTASDSKSVTSAGARPGASAAPGGGTMISIATPVISSSLRLPSATDDDPGLPWVVSVPRVIDEEVEQEYNSLMEASSTLRHRTRQPDADAVSNSFPLLLPVRLPPPHQLPVAETIESEKEGALSSVAAAVRAAFESSMKAPPTTLQVGVLRAASYSMHDMTLSHRLTLCSAPEAFLMASKPLVMKLCPSSIMAKVPPGLLRSQRCSLHWTPTISSFLVPMMAASRPTTRLLALALPAGPRAFIRAGVLRSTTPVRLGRSRSRFFLAFGLSVKAPINLNFLINADPRRCDDNVDGAYDTGPDDDSDLILPLASGGELPLPRLGGSRAGAAAARRSVGPLVNTTPLGTPRRVNFGHRWQWDLPLGHALDFLATQVEAKRTMAVAVSCLWVSLTSTSDPIFQCFCRRTSCCFQAPRKHRFPSRRLLSSLSRLLRPLLPQQHRPLLLLRPPPCRRSSSLRMQFMAQAMVSCRVVALDTPSSKRTSQQLWYVL